MPPYQMNPVNDFYMRNAAQQVYPYQQQFNFPPPQPRLPSIHATWVTSIEEARAARSEDFLATNIFVDTSSGKLYLKRMDNDGKPQFLTYVIEEQPIPTSDPFNEINSRLVKIENMIGGLNVQSVPSNASVQQPATISQPTVTEQNGRYDETKPSSVSENAGNDKWKKRN